MKLIAKVSTGIDLSPVEIDMPDIDKYLDGIDDFFKGCEGGLGGVSSKNERLAITKYMEGESGSDEEAKRVTSAAYENLKKFLMNDNRMEEVKKFMKVFTGDNEKRMWVSRE